MRVHSVIQLGGKTATGIPVPKKVVASLGSSKRPPVRVTINGHTYRSTLASRSGQFMLPISAENRASAGVAAGDEVEVDIELDTAPREVTVPPDLAEALERDVDAKRYFDGFVVQSEAAARAPDRASQDSRDSTATHRQSTQYAARGPELLVLATTSHLPRIYRSAQKGKFGRFRPCMNFSEVYICDLS